AVDISPRSGPDLFLGLLLAALPDQRTDRPSGNPAGEGFPDSSRATLSCAAALVPGSQPAVDLVGQPRSDGHLLDWRCSLHRGDLEPLAAGEFVGLTGLFSCFRLGRTRLFRLSIRRHAARGWVYLIIFRAAWAVARSGRQPPAFAR